jgi:hypothetical protein
MFKKVQAAVEKLPRQRLHGISTGEWGEVADLFGTVDLPGATQIELPPTLADWPDRSEEKSGFKLQLKPDGRNRQFKEALLEAPDGNDNNYFSDLLGLKDEDPSGEFSEEESSAKESSAKAPRGDLYLFDCGCCSTDLHRRITDTGNSFFTKLHGNIAPQFVCRRPVPKSAADPNQNSAGYSVLEDRLVRLGDDRTDREGDNPGRWYRVLTAEVSTEEQINVLTNLLWPDAEQICRPYKHWWSIEIVFRWIKDQMQLDRFIGRDPTGVARQKLMALIAWELLAIFNREGEYGPAEARRCWATEVRDQGLVDSCRWTELGSVALTEAEQFEAGPDPKEKAENGPAGREPTTEKRYVTDSLPPSAKQLLQANHRHRQIH